MCCRQRLNANLITNLARWGRTEGPQSHLSPSSMGTVGQVEGQDLQKVRPILLLTLNPSIQWGVTLRTSEALKHLCALAGLHSQDKGAALLLFRPLSPA